MTRDEIRYINSLVDKSRYSEHNLNELVKVHGMLGNTLDDVYSRKICKMALNVKDNNDANYTIDIPNTLFETLIAMLTKYYENSYDTYEKEILGFKSDTITESGEDNVQQYGQRKRNA